MIYLNSSKAFDLVPHRRLIANLGDLELDCPYENVIIKTSSNKLVLSSNELNLSSDVIEIGMFLLL